MKKTLILCLFLFIPPAFSQDALTWVPISRGTGLSGSEWTTTLNFANGSGGKVVVFFIQNPLGNQLGSLVLEAGQAGTLPDVVSALQLPEGNHVIRLLARCVDPGCDLSNAVTAAVTRSTGATGTPVRNLLILAGSMHRTLMFTTDGRRRVHLWGPAGARAFDATGLVVWDLPVDQNANAEVRTYPLPDSAAYVTLEGPLWKPGDWPIAFGWATETSAENNSTVIQ